MKHREDDRSEQIHTLMQTIGCTHLSTNTIFRVGIPFQVLIEIVQEESVDMVVIGQKGRGNISEILFGSNAEKMFRHCPVPLLSVPHRTGEQPEKPRE